jgi:hypothetical protein
MRAPGDHRSFDSGASSTSSIARCGCGAQLKIIAAIEEPVVIARILTHLGLAARPGARAFAQPRSQNGGHDDGSAAEPTGLLGPLSPGTLRTTAPPDLDANQSARNMLEPPAVGGDAPAERST